MSIDPSQLLSQILQALRGEVTQGWNAIRGFVESQSKMLATQASFITQSRIAGSLRDDDRLFAFFVQQLKDMTRNLARAVSAMTIVTLEKAWNAVVGVVWGAVNGALGAAGLGGLAIPRAPKPQS